MTPKEKAIGLVNKYSTYSYGITEQNMKDCQRMCFDLCPRNSQ